MLPKQPRIVHAAAALAAVYVSARYARSVYRYFQQPSSTSPPPSEKPQQAPIPNPPSTSQPAAKPPPPPDAPPTPNRATVPALPPPPTPPLAPEATSPGVWRPSFGWLVLWDLENVAVPRNTTGHAFVKALRTRLADYRPAASAAPVLRIVAVTNALRLPVQLRNQLQANGVSLHHVETKARKDAADKALITELCLLTREHPPPFGVVLISGDADFAYPMARVRNLGYTTVIVAPGAPGNCATLLKCIPDAVWNLHKDVLQYSTKRPVAAHAECMLNTTRRAESCAVTRDVDMDALRSEVAALKKELLELKISVKPSSTANIPARNDRHRKQAKRDSRISKTTAKGTETRRPPTPTVDSAQSQAAGDNLVQPLPRMSQPSLISLEQEHMRIAQHLRQAFRVSTIGRLGAEYHGLAK